MKPEQMPRIWRKAWGITHLQPKRITENKPLPGCVWLRTRRIMKTYKMPGEPATTHPRRQVYASGDTRKMMDELIDKLLKRDGRMAPQNPSQLITYLVEHELDRLQMEK
jgi:hypothetical protein